MGPPPSRASSNVVTADIQAGIEAYIEARTREGGGFFRFADGDTVYAFRLVRVHTEYLSNLGPRSHFACVDLADTAGDVHDVDFFLAGDPGDMRVTSTTLHKLNGRPFYLWRRADDGTWGRVATDRAPEDLLEVVRGRDAFEFRYEFRVPDLERPGRAWVPLPRSDSYQTVTRVRIDAPAPYRVLEDAANGNSAIVLELDALHAGKSVRIRYDVTRREKAAYPSLLGEPARHLASERRVPVNAEFRRLAEEVVRGKRGELVRARALYDHVMDRMRYMKFGEGFGEGDAVRACDAASGNCTDYHAYFISLARSIGIPARFAVGAAVPASRDDGGIDGYHCWVEFHAEGKWWPVDISEADKYAALSTYYFGHHPANRIEFSRGRDLVFEPGPATGPINFFAYPVLEEAGRPRRVVPTLSFIRR